GIALDKATLTARLVQRTNELERLAARTVGQLEGERARISRELHDETAQALAAVRMRLAVLGEELGPSAAPQLEGAVEALRDAIASIRRVASHLRPAALDELGLAPALRALARDFGVSSTLDVDFHEEGQLLRLPADHELTIYRCLQEGLSNVARHAGASSVEIALSQSGDGICLRVSDDGRSEVGVGSAHGFGFGLAGMQERATALGGRVDFDQAEEGSVLTVFIPMPVHS
ncbi:MAG: sensor histidine kinase, partial [Gemmatimonadota bacterium]|nr:sensor histidine kinase [Gemmatimonadota bacterium]